MAKMSQMTHGGAAMGGMGHGMMAGPMSHDAAPRK
jgi:hypothetical protein